MHDTMLIAGVLGAFVAAPIGFMCAMLWRMFTKLDEIKIALDELVFYHQYENGVFDGPGAQEEKGYRG